jgi:DNA-binding NarL/FixJ family response regulator
MKLDVLIIEDQEMMIEGYKGIFFFYKEIYDAKITEANNCEEAYNLITNKENNSLYQVVILDYSLKAFPEKKVFNGLDLGVLIRDNMPNAKIIMITSHYESIKLFEIVKKIQPNGLLIKHDYKAKLLIDAVKTVLDNETYYSPEAKESIKQPLFTTGALDKIDREIIVLIAEGLQISSIAKKLNASDDTIKKRKSKIKDLLGILKGSDEDILRECRALGLI